MPELPEVEAYRRLAERALGRRIAVVDAPDDWYLKDGAHPAVLVARTFTAARRIGKLLLLDTDDDGPTLGLRFGMTGRLVVDGIAGVDTLLYTSDRALGAWDRFAVRFEDGGDMRVRDPRRLGGVLIDPDVGGMGPDAAGVTIGELRACLAGSAAPLKARLMDQARVAGIGNLLADELLWRAGLSPVRAAGSLTPAELRRLHRHVVGTVGGLMETGSHTGDLMDQRRAGGVCPKDGTPLRRDTVGGRTSFWCPHHQT